MAGDDDDFDDDDCDDDDFDDDDFDDVDFDDVDFDESPPELAGAGLESSDLVVDPGVPESEVAGPDEVDSEGALFLSVEPLLSVEPFLSEKSDSADTADARESFR